MTFDGWDETYANRLKIYRGLVGAMEEVLRQAKTIDLANVRYDFDSDHPKFVEAKLPISKYGSPTGTFRIKLVNLDREAPSEERVARLKAYLQNLETVIADHSQFAKQK